NHLTNASQLAIGKMLRIPTPRKPTAEINAYITEMDESGRDDVLSLGRFFTYLSPFMYSMREDGTITSLGDEKILEAAKKTNTAPLLVLTNYRDRNFDSDLAASILRSQSVQETLI